MIGTGTAVCQNGRVRPKISARGLVLLTALLGIAADQITKALVVADLEGRSPVHVLGDAVTFDVSRNSGAAFSFAPAATVLFTVIAVGVAVLIVRTAATLRSRLWALALGLILAGAVGNLIDRVLRAPGVGRGAVVDFIDVRYFATFNVADSCITVGAVIAVLLSWRGVPMSDKPTR
jgi:signal peptidase II